MPIRFPGRVIAAAFGVLLALSGVSLAQMPPPADAVFALTTTRENGGDMVFHWRISQGHYLYRDSITAGTDDGKPLAITTPTGAHKDDPNFGPTEIYHDTAWARVAAGDLPPSGDIRINYQGCAERGICYPPVSKTVDPATLVQADPPPALQTPPDDAQSPRLSGNLSAMLVAFFGFGLLLALTPCVFPMVPILSGMLANTRDPLSAGRGFVLSCAYVLAMALAYAALGVAAAWSGQNLQVALQTPLALGLMSLVFLALALSMFGLYDIQLPSAWSAALSGRASGRNGSIAGAAVLGFSSALIVGPCVTPPLAAALLYVAQTGDVARGAAGLFALGLGMGLPLVIFGTFGGKVLPKAGPWLVAVKQAFGFVFIGLAIWMLSRFLPGTATMLLWGLLAISCGIWLEATRSLGKLCGRAFPRVAGTVAILYGLLLIASIFSAVPTAPPTGSGFIRTVSTPTAFDAALSEARAESKPVLVDFTAAWCTVCREIDQTVMADPQVLSRLEKIAVIRADVSTDTADSQALMRRFNVVGPPTMLFVDAATGQEILGTRTIGAITAETFLHTLHRSGV
jgi:thiol:disulfide interchange protein DsbD